MLTGHPSTPPLPLAQAPEPEHQKLDLACWRRTTQLPPRHATHPRPNPYIPTPRLSLRLSNPWAVVRRSTHGTHGPRGANPGRTAPAGEPRAPPPPRPSPPPRARRRAGGGGAPRIRIAPPRPPWGEEGGAGGDSRRRPRARGGGAIRGGHPARWQGSLLLHFSPSFLLRFCFVSPSFLLRFYPSFLLMMTLVTML